MDELQNEALPFFVFSQCALTKHKALSARFGDKLFILLNYNVNQVCHSRIGTFPQSNGSSLSLSDKNYVHYLAFWFVCLNVSFCFLKLLSFK